ncbi:hypothetical protein KY332_01590 [Candidatus Woesearchaeota archaeon]|nr:hypothetical protein [Candidatus Woesearchaeota archaeon]
MALRLEPYVRKQLAAGYDIKTIRDFLIRSGYDVRDINKAIDAVYKKKPRKPIPLKGVLVAVLIIVVLIAGILFIFNIMGEEEVVETVTFAYEREVEEVKPLVKEEIPGGAVVVVEEITCPDSCDDKDACTIDYCGKETSYVCVNQRVRPCCGNDICEGGETSDNCRADCKEVEVYIAPAAAESLTDVVLEAKELAKASPGSAASYCSRQTKQNVKDSCYKAVAESAKQSVYCDEIVSELKADSCYVTAATEWNDFSVCAKINDKYLQLACNNLAEAS